MGETTKLHRDDATGEEVEQGLRFLKTYIVFNANQIDGLANTFHNPHVTAPPALSGPEPNAPLRGSFLRLVSKFGTRERRPSTTSSAIGSGYLRSRPSKPRKATMPSLAMRRCTGHTALCGSTAALGPDTSAIRAIPGRTRR